MRIPRIKLSIRGMMIAIAVGAVFLWAGQAGLRWLEYRGLVSSHEQVARALKSEIATLRFYAEAHRSRAERVPASLLSDIRDREVRLEIETKLVRIYDRAASRPWRAIGDVDGVGSSR